MTDIGRILIDGIFGKIEADEEIEGISGGGSWSDDCGRFKNRRLINP